MFFFQTESLGKYTYTANEKYARLLALYLFTLTTYGWNYFNKNCSNSYKTGGIKVEMVQLIEKTLTIYQFLYQEKFMIGNERNDRSAKDEVKKFLNLVKKLLRHGISDEQELSGICKFPKFHYLMHVCDMILRFGSARNFDGGPSESHHKYLSKEPGKRAQGNQDTFEEQTSYNCASQLILDRVCRENNIFIGGRSGVSSLLVPQEIVIENDEKISIHQKSSHFVLKYINGSVSMQWNKGKNDGLDVFEEEVMKYVEKTLFKSKLIEEITVPGFTCLYWKNQIIRAHPCYRRRSPWHDFAKIRWGGGTKNQDYYCPSQVQLFLDLRNVTFSKEAQEKDNKRWEPGLYLVVRSTSYDMRNDKPTRDAVSVWRTRSKSNIVTFWGMEENFWLIHVKSIVGTAFVISDFSDSDMSIRTKHVMEVKPIEEWAALHY